jgi:hypothetical protein
MTVTVNSNVTPSFAQINPICLGGSFSLPTTSSNGIAGSWSPAVNNTATTTYTFTPTPGQCATTATMTVVVNPNVTPSFAQIAPICSGGSFSLPATSDNSITGTWSPAVNNTATTTYTFTPNSGQCATTTTMTVVVNQQPTLSIGTVACDPDLLTYSLNFTATGGTVSATAGTVSGSSVTAIPTGTAVTITVTNPANGACSATQAVSAPNCSCPSIPAPLVAPTQVAICSGDPFPTFTASVESGLIVNWYSAATGGTLLLGNSLSFTPSTAGIFYAEAVNPLSNCTSSTRTPATVMVNQPVTPTFAQVAPICSGGSFSLPTTSSNGIIGSWSPAVNNSANNYLHLYTQLRAVRHHRHDDGDRQSKCDAKFCSGRSDLFGRQFFVANHFGQRHYRDLGASGK